MKKDELWKIYIEKNPHWLTNGASLTPQGIKKLFEQTYDIAHHQGVENGKALGSKCNDKKDFQDILKSFGI